MLQIWESLCKEFTPEQLSKVLRRTVPGFRPIYNSLDSLIIDDVFDKAAQIGVIELPDTQTVFVGAVHVKGELTARSGKRKQYDLAKRILRHGDFNAGIFAFYDNAGRFRFSLVTITYHGTKRQYSTFRRYTFFVDPELPNKTFLQQMQRADFSSISGILETFSLEAVTDEFYKEFKNKFDALAAAVQGTDDTTLKQDFALLFAIRIIFLGFVQKKGWLDNNRKFIQNFWEEYRQSGSTDTFYKDWLEPLFFEALSSPPGQKVAYGHAPFSAKTQKALQMAPYLNGELFKRKHGVDDLGLWIPDEPIGDFFDFLFQYNFTVEENELYDEELELNPEFLGIIFERITNKDQGAVYTPRLEVDFMCRLALVKWLEQTTDIEKKDLYRLFFREAGTGEASDEYQKQGDFSPSEIRTLIERLENVTICDPAAGSGAFEVGMLQVLEQVLENLYSRNNTPEDLKNKALDPYERKKAIIANSLYGVEVKRWAVWINHLRLWLTLFVDMPDDLKGSFEPLLPNLTFKVRTGDSLVQRIGSKTFPVHGHADLPQHIKRRITQLKQKKRDYFYNKNKDYGLIEQEELAIFRAILDEEIMQRERQIRDANRVKQKQLALFETNAEQMELDFSEEYEALRARLEAEIEDLKNQKKSLKDNRPFIWNIEFAEIFFDRGGFDIIIGNPPYVRQEEIVDPDPNRGLKPQAYKDALLEMLRLDFPDYFTKSRVELDKFKTGRKPSGRSDLYTYFYIRSLRLLNPRGVHVFICSNSWLDVDYGTWLQEFFLRQAPLYYVIENHARRSFARADINTVITVAGAPKRVNENHIVRFVAFKRPFEDVILSDNLLAIEQATTILRNKSFRVFPITVGELLREGSEIDQNLSQLDNHETFSINQLGKYVGDKWGGKYLRAPDIFFTILEKGRGKLVRLGDIAEVRRGFTTGANEFFYLEPLGPGSKPGLLRVRNGAGWEGEIEEEFLKPVIKSPRECRSIMIKPEELRYRIFMCHKSKKELKSTMALKYIEWGEKKGYSRRSTCNSRTIWWSLPNEMGNIFWGKELRERIAVFISLKPLLADCRLYVAMGDESLQLILNSIISIFVDEIKARQYGGGGGPRSLMVYEVNQQLVLSPALLDNRKEQIKNILLQLALRPVGSIFTECGIDPESDVPIAKQEPKPLPDRKALDDIVFDALGLTEEERKEVYRAVCQLVWERISKARSVTRNG
jgi:hypothetical protein